MLQKFKYGTDDIYEKMRIEIKKSPLFRFDWFLKSRSAAVFLLKLLILGN